MSFSPTDQQMMSRALHLAMRGLYTTTPNPHVGCVIAKDEKIIGEGWHMKSGEAHAEVFALRQAGNLANGATAYVSLEPCSHFGRTAPCATALINAGIKRVVCAMEDPFPKVAGQGFANLRAAGIICEIGLMNSEARQINKGFLSRIERNRPWVSIKIGCSLDGKTALLNGSSQWITGNQSRADVQKLRARSCAILTGSGCVLADNPQLNIRDIADARQPKRIILDSKLATNPQSRIFSHDGGKSIVVTLQSSVELHQAYLDAGAEILLLPSQNNHINLQLLMQKLGEMEINELLVEAGATLNGALLLNNLVDEIIIYAAPTFLGNQAKGLFNLPELTDLTQQWHWQYQEISQIGEDLRIVLSKKQFLRPAAKL